MENERFKSTTAVLVAFVTVLGAIAACMATGAMSSAANADFEGMNAAIRAQKAEIVNQIAFTEYTRYLEFGNLLYDPNADEETSIKNGVPQREVWGIAVGLGRLNFFEPRYVTSDGFYNLQRELDAMFSEDAEVEDLDSAPYFEMSEKMRRRSYVLTADMIVLAVSFWFLQLGQVTEHKVKYVWVVIGVLLGLGGILGMLIGGNL